MVLLKDVKHKKMNDGNYQEKKVIIHTNDQLLFILMEVLGTQQIIKTIIKLILTKA